MPSVNFDKTTLIRDRTQADVDTIIELRDKALRVGLSELTSAELSQLTTASKGCLNYTDINRWGSAMNAIATVINTYGYSLSTSNKTDLTLGAVYSASYANTFISNLNAMLTAVNDLFQDEAQFSIAWGGGYNATLTTLPFSNTIMTQPSWSDVTVTPINLTTLDYSTYADWNMIEQFFYEVIVFLEELP